MLSNRSGFVAESSSGFRMHASARLWHGAGRVNVAIERFLCGEVALPGDLCLIYPRLPHAKVAMLVLEAVAAG